MRSKFSKYIPALFLLILVFTLGNIFFTYKNLLAVRENEKIVDQTATIKLAVKNTLADIYQAQLEQKNFLLTNNPIHETTYATLSRQIKKDFMNLQLLTQHNPQEQKHISAILTASSPSISLTKNSAQDHTLFLLQQYPFEQLQQELEAINQIEDKQLAGKQDAALTSYHSVTTTSALAGLLNIILIGVAFYFTRRELVKQLELEKNKDEFISMASHELKTPITSLKVYTKVLANKLDGNQPVHARHYISKIETQTQKLTSLVTDLLDMSRVQTGKLKLEKKPFNLDALIDETVESIRGTTRKHTITITGNILRTVHGDEYRIYQVLVNLLTNATKYSPDGGQIFVTSKVEDTVALVSIKDQGIGIDQAYQHKIFDRFYQVSEPTEKTFPGLGIGLYVTAEIIKLHGGKIWVESEKGKGSTFYFTLPISEFAS